MEEQLKKGIRVQVVNATGFFSTPPELVERMIAAADLRPGNFVLEPSAGSGSIIRGIVEEGGCCITAVEINNDLFNHLKSEFEHLKIFNTDFLSCNGDLGKFNRILMNPPFENAADIKHIQHARGFLKPGGRLVAICAGGPRQERELKPVATTWEPLPEGSFRVSGTMVNTVLLTIEN
jgi:phospholipid N-methyltransferase